jgi:hypothetical protein
MSSGRLFVTYTRFTESRLNDEAGRPDIIWMMKRGSTVLALLLVLAACGGTTPAASEPANEVAASAPVTWDPPQMFELPEPSVESTDTRPMWEGFAASLENHRSLAAMARGETEVFAAPGDADPMVTMPATTILGTVTVLAVVGEPIDGWAEVMLPIRPNGSTGWLRTEDVKLFVVDGSVTVDLSEKELVYHVNGEEVLRTTVAIGTNQNPTPTGRFFVTDSVTLSNPTGPWGSHALGLSARSDTITEFNGGDGIIGIHGTNSPSSIGTAASLGCVRLPNEMISMLHQLAPIGTPVEIRA